MAYREYRYESSWGIEHVCCYMGRYGAKGERRQKKEKATPEQIRKQNLINRRNYVRRMIQLNFKPGDIWETLKYPKGTRKPIEEVEKELDRFIRRMRKIYRSNGMELFYIARIEIGKQGGIHVHIVMNRMGVPNEDVILSDAWMRARKATPIGDMLEEGLYPPDGLAHLDHVRAVGNGEKLAEYLVKEQPGVLDDGTVVTREDIRKISRYKPSRNLRKPKPEVKVFTHWTMRRILELGADGINSTSNRYRTEGYIIDKESWVQGVNPVTGLSYLRYMEVKSPPGRKQEK